MWRKRVSLIMAQPRLSGCRYEVRVTGIYSCTPQPLILCCPLNLYTGGPPRGADKALPRGSTSNDLGLVIEF
jgi:hypothetical protein